MVKRIGSGVLGAYARLVGRAAGIVLAVPATVWVRGTLLMVFAVGGAVAGGVAGIAMSGRAIINGAPVFAAFGAVIAVAGRVALRDMIVAAGTGRVS